MADFISIIKGLWTISCDVVSVAFDLKLYNCLMIRICSMSRLDAEQIV
jgi:hypothetical protein